MAFVEKAIFFTEGRGSMYLSELFLQVLEEKSDANAAQKALEVCNKEFCRQMNGVVDEKDCITYFFYTDENNDIIKPNDRYQELMDFWDVYQGFDDEIPHEAKKNMWILQMIYEADINRVSWEKEKRKQQLSLWQLNSLHMLSQEFEEKIGKKELIILRRGRKGFHVWERMELQGFDGESSVPESDFIENELIKLYQSEGMIILIVGRKGLTPQRIYGYYLSDHGYKRLEEREINGLQETALQEECPMAMYRGRLRGNSGIYVENPYSEDKTEFGDNLKCCI